MSLYYIGIDNGLDGGITLLDSNSRILQCEIMPTENLGKGRQVPYAEVRDLFREWLTFENLHQTTFLIEKPNNAQTCSTAASMASSFARCECALIELRVRYQAITPQSWQNSKMFWTKPKMAKGQKFDTKAAALVAATKLWPNQDWTKSERAIKAHDGKIDSALIAEYGRRKNL